MKGLDVVLQGVPVSSARGALGWSNAVLFRSRGRTILFDTGSCGDRRLLIDRLAALGVAPTEIDLVFGSHFHFDHVANAEILDCPVALSAEEWRYVEAGHYLKAEDPFVPRALIPYLRERIATVEDGEEVAPGVRAVLLPGHTPGTCGLLFSEERVLLTGDAVKNAWDFARGEPPPCFHSRETAVANYARIRAMARVVVPGHDRAFEIGGDGALRHLSSSEVVLDVYADPGAAGRQVRLIEA